MTSKIVRLTPDLLNAVYAALPENGGVDYWALREKVMRSQKTVRQAVTVLIERRQAEAVRGVVRNRKLFKRVPLQGGIQCGN